MAEVYSSWSPFNYTICNPINFIDPDGMAIDTAYHINIKTGKQTTISNKGGASTDYYTIDNGLPMVHSEYEGTTYVVDNTNSEDEILLPASGAITPTENPIEMLLEGPIKFSAMGLFALIKGISTSRGDNVIAYQVDNLVKLNNGKSRVTLKSEKTRIDIDLKGPSHFDKATQTRYPTPHTRTSARNFRAPNQPAYNTRKGTYRTATKEDIRMIRKYLKSKNRK